MKSSAADLIRVTARLRDEVEKMTFGAPAEYVYNPLVYAWRPHEAYLRKWGAGSKQTVFLGMNPGPWGMAQVGVPFGEIGYVRDWVGIAEPVGKPAREHPKRPIDGFDCARSEVSGRRLWGHFADRFGNAETFFATHFVLNYCPLMFLETSGRNVTPDKLKAADREPLLAACDRHLREVVAVLDPEWVIGVGAFAAGRAREVLAGEAFKIGQVLHPSPASPAANRGWAEAADKQLRALGVWG